VITPFEYLGGSEVEEEGMRVRNKLGGGVFDIFPLSSGEAADTVPTFYLK
jgi:hypothetical protein